MGGGGGSAFRRRVERAAEPPLQMTVEQLGDLRRAIDEVDGRPGRLAFPDFLLCLDGD